MAIIDFASGPWRPNEAAIAEMRSGAKAGVRRQGPFNSREEFERQYFRPGLWNTADLQGQNSFLVGINPWDRGKKFYDGTESKSTGNPASSLTSRQNRIPPATRNRFVFTPSGKSRKRLFGTSPGDKGNRHDCELVDGVYYCAYTDDQYQNYREQIIRNEQLISKDLQAAEEKAKEIEAIAERMAKARGMGSDQDKLIDSLDKKLELSEEEKKRLRQTNAQHALFLGFKDITLNNSILMPGAIVLDKIQNNFSYGGTPVSPITDIEWERALDSKPDKICLWAGNPEPFVNSIINPYGAADFFCADSGQLSALVPTVDFYLGVGASDKGEEIYERVAFSDFSSGNKIKTLSSVAYSDPTAVLKDRGTLGTDVGITSFDWEWDNKHEGYRVLNATLKLHFQSIRELNNQRYLDFVFLDMRNKPGVPAAATGIKSWKDYKKSYSNAMPRSKEIRKLYTAALDVEGDGVVAKDYVSASEKSPSVSSRELKVIVGWATPQGPGADKLIGPSFRAALDRSRKTILLHLNKYDLEFGQNGQVDLTLSYNGSIDTYLDDSGQTDIFEVNGIAKDSYSKQYEISAVYRGDEQKEEPGYIAAALDMVGINLDGGVPPTYKDAISPGPEKTPSGPGLIRTYGEFGSMTNKDDDGKSRSEPSLKVSMAVVEAEISRLKMLVHYWKLRQSSQLDATGGVPSAAIKKDLELAQGWMKAAVSIKNQVNIKMKADKNSALLGTLLKSGKLFYATINKNFIRDAKAAVAADYVINIRKSNAPGGVPESSTEALSKRAQNAVTDALDTSTGKAGYVSRHLEALSLDPLTPKDMKTASSEVRVYYFRLGDLVDMVVKEVPNRLAYDLVLGTFYPQRLGIPGFSPGQVASIADIPISIDYFSQWFLDNISKKGIDRMSIRRFLDLLFNRLVAPLFNSTWNDKIESGSINDRIYFDFTAATLPYKFKDEITRAGRRENEIIDYVVFPDTADKNNRNYQARFGERNSKIHNTMLIFASNGNSSKYLNGDRQKDEARGIYHLILGSECNVVKNFSFTEKRMPQLRAQMIENNMHMNGLLLPQDCDITMFGNTFFKNGSMVYINAEFGLGAAAEGLGVGGYYKVYKVSNSIESGNFETRLSLMREFGRGGSEI